jgi:hypothetical protein
MADRVQFDAEDKAALRALDGDFAIEGSGFRQPPPRKRPGNEKPGTTGRAKRK